MNGDVISKETSPRIQTLSLLLVDKQPVVLCPPNQAVSLKEHNVYHPVGSLSARLKIGVGSNVWKERGRVTTFHSEMEGVMERKLIFII